MWGDGLTSNPNADSPSQHPNICELRKLEAEGDMGKARAIRAKIEEELRKIK
jgi:hypothetical protein